MDRAETAMSRETRNLLMQDGRVCVKCGAQFVMQNGNGAGDLCPHCYVVGLKIPLLDTPLVSRGPQEMTMDTAEAERSRESRIQRPHCCDAWERARQPGSGDCEIDELIWHSDESCGFRIGWPESGFPPVRFCPWCGFRHDE